MIIKTKTKDYYDYIQHLNGGGDPLIRYDRMPIKDRAQYYDQSAFNRDHHYYLWDIARTINDRQRRLFSGPDLEFIMVCGKLYIAKEGKILMGEKADKFVLESNWMTGRKYYTESGAFREQFVSVCKNIGTPVFKIGYGWEGIEPQSVIPNLGEYGFASIISAEQMYQNIAYFISTELMPKIEPIQISDKDRVIQHGFDTKQSFRHRM